MDAWGFNPLPPFEISLGNMLQIEGTSARELSEFLIFQFYGFERQIGATKDQKGQNGSTTARQGATRRCKAHEDVHGDMICRSFPGHHVP